MQNIQYILSTNSFLFAIKCCLLVWIDVGSRRRQSNDPLATRDMFVEKMIPESQSFPKWWKWTCSWSRTTIRRIYVANLLVKIQINRWIALKSCLCGYLWSAFSIQDVSSAVSVCSRSRHSAVSSSVIVSFSFWIGIRNISALGWFVSDRLHLLSLCFSRINKVGFFFRAQLWSFPTFLSENDLDLDLAIVICLSDGCHVLKSFGQPRLYNEGYIRQSL